MKPTTISVPLITGGYSVIIGDGLLSDADLWASLIKEEQAVCVTNDTVAALYGQNLQNLLDGRVSTIILPDGEQYKTLATVETIIDALAADNMRRDGVIIALGGGVIGDVAGFAASIYMRGIRLIQAPTTLLAQVDAAIGGKTGVNHPAGKNMLGAFYQPSAVICDPRALKTLPAREYVAGLAEVIKYALLGDANFFAWLEMAAEELLARESAAVHQAIARSAQMKADIVSVDERENNGRRALLNLGHTFAHGVENAAGYGTLLHGEAVAIGLVAAARLSERLTQFAAADTERIIALLRRLQLPVNFAGADAEAILTAMQMDKKHTAREWRFIVLNSIGDARQQCVTDMKIARQVIEEML